MSNTAYGRGSSIPQIRPEGAPGPLDLYAVRKAMADVEIPDVLLGQLSSLARGFVPAISKAEAEERSKLCGLYCEAACPDDPDSVRKGLEDIDPWGEPPIIPMAPVGPRPKLVCPLDVEEQPVQWLWPQMIPLGMITTFNGDPKQGKSLAAIDAVARVSNGARWPDGSDGTLGSALILAAEDDMAHTIVPRLRIAEANLARIRILEAVIKEDGQEAFPDLRRDLPALEAALEEMGDCRLVIIDPITGYLGGTDQNDNGQVRSVLGPLKVIAERHNVAVVLISHFVKGARDSVMKKVAGSIAFTAAARANFGFISDPEQPGRRYMLPIGCNLSDPPGMSYRIATRPRSDTPGDNIALIEWDSQPVRIDADDLMRVEREDPSEREERTECERWLSELLTESPLTANEVQKKARGAGFSAKMVERAKARLGIKSVKQGFGAAGKWVWCLPNQRLSTPMDAIDPDCPPFGPGLASFAVELSPPLSPQGCENKDSLGPLAAFGGVSEGRESA